MFGLTANMFGKNRGHAMHNGPHWKLQDPDDELAAQLREEATDRFKMWHILFAGPALWLLIAGCPTFIVFMIKWFGFIPNLIGLLVIVACVAVTFWLKRRFEYHIDHHEEVPDQNL